MKLLAVILLLAVVAVPFDAYQETQDWRWRHYKGEHYRWGRMGPWDRLICQTRASHNLDIWRQYYKRNSVPSKVYGFRGVATMDVTLPGVGDRSRGRITYVQAVDMSNGRLPGTRVSIIGGGIGCSYVTFHLESSSDCGFDYALRVYGC